MEKIIDDGEWSVQPHTTRTPREVTSVAMEQRRWYHVVRGRAARPVRRPAPQATGGPAMEGPQRPAHSAGRDTRAGVDDSSQTAAQAGIGAPSATDPVVLCLVIRGSDSERVLTALRRRGLNGPILIESAADLRLKGTRAAPGIDGGLARSSAFSATTARQPESTVRQVANGESWLSEARPPLAYFGDVVVDAAARTILRRGEPVSLTSMEFNLLLALLRRHGAVASRGELLEEVWGRGLAETSRTVDAHVYKLRRKLETDPTAPRHILTVQKAGYRLQT